MKYYPLNEDAARVAHEMNHFGAFRSDVPEYCASVDEAYSLAEDAAKLCPERKDESLALADSSARYLAEWYNEQDRIDAMCPSAMVSGPANFPTGKKNKQNRARDRHWKEYRKIENIKERIKGLGDAPDIIKSGDSDAIEKLRAKADALAKRQEDMKAANAKARKEGKGAPYPACSLSNNRNNLRATRQRLERLEAAKEAGTTERETEGWGEPARVVENTELMRLQLFFDGKPPEEVRSALKHNGFRWSPKQGAWQRQLTDNARYALKRLTECRSA